MKTRFIAITGVKKAGKTTTIEYLIPKIIAKGYKVGVAKIAYKPVSIDVNQEHYDVIRLRKAKPTKTLFKSKIETTIFFEDELTLRQALSEFGKGLDIVLLEGFPDDFIGFPQIAILKDNTEINDVKNEFTVALSSIPEFSLKITDPLFIEFSTLDTIVEKFAQPLLPELNCKHCGFENCNEFMKEVLKGNKHYQDCFVMNAENLELMLKVNGNIIPCNPFVQSVLKNVILGVIKSIKLEDKEISEMEITVKLDEKSREVIE